jgi:hypothetical protein
MALITDKAVTTHLHYLMFKMGKWKLKSNIQYVILVAVCGQKQTWKTAS